MTIQANGHVTTGGKEHFEVLDGLRGTAALLVVLFHIQGITVGFRHADLMLPHAFLAVDFFFVLSGFVIGYAYDDRWARLGTAQFFKLRLIRLHPLVVLGMLLGFLSYVFDPFAAGTQNSPIGTVLVALALGLLLLPNNPLPNRWTDTHSLDGPAWTLLQEYIGNVAYALVLRKLAPKALAVLAVIAGLVLAVSAMVIGTLDRGYAWENMWMGPVRLAYPFITGLLLYRLKDRWPKVRINYVLLSLVLVVCFAMPTPPVVDGVKLNGAYEAACVLLLFPAIVVAGAHSQAGSGMVRACRAMGRISYPIYITHFPFLFIWTNYLVNQKPPQSVAILTALALIPFTIGVAWAASALWDLPIRSRLMARFGRARA